MATTLINDIIQQLNDLDDGDLWLDENFAKKLEQVNEKTAFTRPLPDLHSPAELLSHLIVWRRINIRRMNGETVRLQVDDPINWKSNEELRPKGWKALKKEFYQSKQEVIDMLDGKDDSYLDTVSTYYGKDFKYLLEGLVHHDLYHLGQLGIVVKFLKR
ncbi:MAG: DinB family protein [Chitinophagaceae bacterium]|nr:MAG: DinB family protein [Chitinophagaceae bacterium]